MFAEFLKNLSNNNLEEIYYTGCFDLEDRDFIMNTNYLFLKIGIHYINFEACETYSKLKITLSETINYKNEVEDWIDGKIKVSELVFVDSLIDSRAFKKVSFVNLQKSESYLISDVVCFEFKNGEILFIDPSFFGIKIGGREQKDYWYSENKINSSKEENIEEVFLMQTEYLI